MALLPVGSPDVGQRLRDEGCVGAWGGIQPFSEESK